MSDLVNQPLQIKTSQRILLSDINVDKDPTVINVCICSVIMLGMFYLGFFLKLYEFYSVL